MPRYTRTSTLRRPRLWRPPTKAPVVSTVSYANIPWIRPTGGPTGKLPLVLRNPQNDNTKIDYMKCGPTGFFKLGRGLYRSFFEGVTDQTGAISNRSIWATCADGWTWTKDYTTPLVPNTGDWENGELCVTYIFYDAVERLFKAYYHGGNNAGNRQVGLLTAPRSSQGVPGSWTRYGGNPVLVNGGAGAWDEKITADFCIISRSGATWYAVYHGARASDGRGQTGVASSTDRGYTWTKSAGNPELPFGSGNDANGAKQGWGYEDELGRFHYWYTGEDASGEWRILYAFSDDRGATWTRNAAQVILAGQASTQPDDNVGDTVSALEDEGLILFTCMGFNLSTYTGDAVGRLEGRTQYWLPKEAASQPTRPGRAFTTQVANSRVTVNAAAKLLNSTVFTIWSDFKIPPGSLYHTIYGEYAAFNKEIFVRLDNQGRAAFEVRTPTGQALANGTTRWDDNQYHWMMLRRTATNAFELLVDGISQATSSVTVGVDNTAMAVTWGNWDPAVGADEPTMGILRQGVTIQGRALTVSEAWDLWNGGADGGVLPAGVTATCWVKHGSGGAAGPDAAYGGATYGTAVGAGTKLVNAAPDIAITSLPPLLHRGRIISRRRLSV